MSANLVNLNTNPCKMCMPLGAASAFYGIRKCMTILHGSQGCSTYIRRHMATHYNEPVDIASSSLTEEGTVFGGAKNLLTGLANLIKLYDPEVIGVATTCLAETIGEDVPAIIKEFKESHPEVTAHIIPVASPGYGGSQYEGFFRALHAIVRHTPMNPAPNGCVNIITGHLSAADTRALKALLEASGLDCILLPDLSQNLDGGHEATYNRLPQHGTPLARISLMAGARMTLELAPLCPEEYSPGACLQEAFGVPLLRLNLPIGLEDTDAFVASLEALGATLPASLAEERARYLDAMIDAHKYNAQCRAAVFGEPDAVLGMTRACCEHGVVPVVAATGSRCPGLDAALRPCMTAAAETQLAEGFDILDFADFTAIENALTARKANLMLGNSDGRRIEERRHIPLLRYGFPIHDRVGGQRTRLLLYDGSLSLMEATANAMLHQTESVFRQELYDKYYTDAAAAKTLDARRIEPVVRPAVVVAAGAQADAAANAARTKSHPCFTCGACSTAARLHLPIAPRCNLSCNYCLRKYDCPNESRPGVTTAVLTPEQAVERFLQVKRDMPNLTVVGIAGPGDSLANPEATFRTLEMIRKEDPNITFCMSTNGLALPEFVEDMRRVGVSHATVTINAVDPAIGAQIYRYAEYRGGRYTGETAAALLLANQLAGLRALTRAGIVCKVNTVMLKGINDTHIPKVVETVRDLGAELTNIMQLIPVKGSAFENMPLVSNKELMDLRKSCEPTLRQMYHCKQCRADAVGLLGDDRSIDYRPPAPAPAAEESAPVPVARGIRIAVASKTGAAVDQHFGQADQFYIYESDGTAARYLETRSVARYCRGMDDCGSGKAGRMDGILAAVDDCKGVLALRIGQSPLEKLQQKGIRVFTLYETVDKAVNEAAKALCG
ncbi:nitrogenase cofactor biosynthesis protein NifB [Desulfovibrio legallii]|uniref:FeMo cofactor biosynthesis protein NifB n=1 Tax=Desulfovibrio legallii TaxID=571438 RepID=A0A1G7PI80_9BACT|nr:nitrogenase cofactor biosynthesis protein NifB [Desulfovibrio legallii]SDF85947.1 nitrogenase cofactor biosynthesis protein NifB [Desulfovibrio legallii]